MKKYLEYVVVIAVALGLAYFLLPGKPATFGSATGYDSVNVTPSATTGDTYSYAVNGMAVFDLNGHLTSSANNCSSQTWNPAAVGSSTVASVDVAVTNYVLGDIIDSATLATSTQGLGINAVTTSTTGIVTALLFDPDNTGVAIDIATTTITVCTSH